MSLSQNVYHELKRDEKKEQKIVGNLSLACFGYFEDSVLENIS